MNATGWGENVADGAAEKFISSLEMFVWCERICRNSSVHEGLVGGGIDVLVSGESGVFPTGLMDPIDVRENLFLA